MYFCLNRWLDLSTAAGFMFAQRERDTGMGSWPPLARGPESDGGCTRLQHFSVFAHLKGADRMVHLPQCCTVTRDAHTKISFHSAVIYCIRKQTGWDGTKEWGNSSQDFFPSGCSCPKPEKPQSPFCEPSSSQGKQPNSELCAGLVLLWAGRPHHIGRLCSHKRFVSLHCNATFTAQQTGTIQENPADKNRIWQQQTISSGTASELTLALCKHFSSFMHTGKPW